MSVISRLSYLLGFGKYRQEVAVPFVTEGAKIVNKAHGRVKYRIQYADGFVCEAWTAQEADKKHRIWWQNVGSKRGGKR